MIDVEDLELRLLLDAIYERYQYDFRSYALASLRRRVLRALPRLGCASISQLQHLVLHEPGAFPQLLGSLTIQVSDLFRDPPYWRAVRDVVAPFLRTFPSFRVWVAGCSNGEEVYSYAILLEEEGLLERATIYATDIHSDALRRAENGIYDLDRVAAFSRNYQAAGGARSLADYYAAAYQGAVFDRALRRNVVFSDHSLATDTVFAEVQLVSCRNVLIYFDRALQDRALGLFAEALSRRGFLGVGTRESLRFSARAAEFEEVRRAERLYRRR
jgi:chemotaxis protein methyltransferase CheR